MYEAIGQRPCLGLTFLHGAVRLVTFTVNKNWNAFVNSIFCSKKKNVDGFIAIGYIESRVKT